MRVRKCPRAMAGGVDEVDDDDDGGFGFGSWGAAAAMPGKWETDGPWVSAEGGPRPSPHSSGSQFVSKLHFKASQSDAGA